MLKRVAVAAVCVSIAAPWFFLERAPAQTARLPKTIPHTLRYSDAQNIGSLNPHLFTGNALSLLSGLTMGWLARYDAQNRPVPELATVIPTQRNGGISRDGKTITWHLRRDAKWSDGVPFDADDVVFSTKTVLNPKNNEIGRDGWDLIDRVEKTDKYTVVFHLKRPLASFLPTFFGSAGANPCLLPKHILGNLADINTAPYNSLPVGIGPFRYVSWKRGDAVELEANPYYFRGRPKLQRIVYKFVNDANTLMAQIQTGELDLWMIAPPSYYDRMRGTPNIRIVKHPGFIYSHLDFNVTRPRVSDVRVRRALRYALDRQKFVSTIFHGAGVVQESMISPSNLAYSPKIRLVPYDLAKANALLDEAGWKRASDGVRAKGGQRLSLDVAIASGSADANAMFELIRADWKQIGAELNLKRYDLALLFAPAGSGGPLYGGKFDAAYFAWAGGSIGDISGQYGCRNVPPAGQNVTRWCNARFDRDMAKFKTFYDPQQRQPFVNDAVLQIVDEVPTVIMAIRENIYMYSNDLKSFKPNGLTPFDNMMAVDI